MTDIRLRRRSTLLFLYFADFNIFTIRLEKQEQSITIRYQWTINN